MKHSTHHIRLLCIYTDTAVTKQLSVVIIS